MRIDHIQTLAGAELQRKALIPEELMEYFHHSPEADPGAIAYAKLGITIFYGIGDKAHTGTANVDGVIFGQEIMVQSPHFTGGYRAIDWHNIDWNNFWIVDSRHEKNTDEHG